MNTKLNALLSNPDFEVTIKINDHHRTTMYLVGNKVKGVSLSTYIRHFINKGVDNAIVSTSSHNYKEIMSKGTIVELYVRMDKGTVMHRFIKHDLEGVVNEAWEFLTLTNKIKS